EPVCVNVTEAEVPDPQAAGISQGTNRPCHAPVIFAPGGGVGVPGDGRPSSSFHPERTMQTASSAGKRRWFHFMVCVSFVSRSKSDADAGSAVERGTDRPVVSDSVLGRGVHLTSEDRSVPLIGSGPSGGW